MSTTPCQDFCCSDFVKHIDSELTGRTPDLVHPIHPIFRRINFNGPNGGIISPLDYHLLKPSLQLASLFLESDPMVLFLIKLFDGDIQTGNGISIPRSELMIERPEGGPLFQAWDVHAEFYPGQEGDPEEPELEGSSVMANGPLNAALQQFFPWGCGSVVCLNHPLEKIKAALRKANNSASSVHVEGCTPARRMLQTDYLAQFRSCDACSWPLELVAARFWMVKTVVHELAHSFCFAAWGRRFLQYDIPMWPGSLGEIGCEVWMALKGGTPRIASDYGDVLGLQKIPGICNPDGAQPKYGGPVGFLEAWPNEGLIQLFLERYGLALRPLNLNLPVKDDLFVRIPLSYFEDMFSQAFWDRVVGEGPDAMRALGVGSWYFKWANHLGRFKPCDGSENQHNLKSLEQASKDKAEGSKRFIAPPPHVSPGRKRKRPLSDVGNPEPCDAYGVGVLRQ